MADMRTMTGIYAAPENRVHGGRAGTLLWLADLWPRRASDSKLPDEQAAAEAAFSLLLETLCGAQMVHDVGYLESGRLNSVEQIVICDELISYVKRFMTGLAINEETLALDVIDAVGPHGDF